MNTTDIFPVGNIQAIPRKESPYDTECIVASSATTLPAQIKLFQNYTSFQVVPVGTTKQADRDTNVNGAVGALPQGYQLLWYEWRASIRTLDANLATAANVVAFENIRRTRQLGAVKYLATQNPLVTATLGDLVSYVDSEFVQTTVNAATVITPTIGFRGGKTMTVGGKPYIIKPTEQLAVQALWPGSNGAYNTSFSAVINLFLTCWLDGVLLRAAG